MLSFSITKSEPRTARNSHFYCWTDRVPGKPDHTGSPTLGIKYGPLQPHIPRAVMQLASSFWAGPSTCMPALLLAGPRISIFPGVGKLLLSRHQPQIPGDLPLASKVWLVVDMSQNFILIPSYTLTLFIISLFSFMIYDHFKTYWCCLDEKRFGIEERLGMKQHLPYILWRKFYLIEHVYLKGPIIHLWNTKNKN